MFDPRQQWLHISFWQDLLFEVQKHNSRPLFGNHLLKNIIMEGEEVVEVPDLPSSSKGLVIPSSERKPFSFTSHDIVECINRFAAPIMAASHFPFSRSSTAILMASMAPVYVESIIQLGPTNINTRFWNFHTLTFIYLLD